MSTQTQLASRKDPKVSGGETRASRNQRSEPRLPHERDESSDSQQSSGDPRVEQAARDIDNGLLDTGRAPVVDELARKHFPASRGGQDDSDEANG